jgi:putative iron-dependent peroxidase
MATAQTGIFSEGSAHHHFLEFEIDGLPDIEAIGSAVRAVLALALADGANLVAAFGPELWRSLAGVTGHPEPEQLEDFQAISGGLGRLSPSTQADILIWIHGPALDDVLDCAMSVNRLFCDVCNTVLDERGFTYHDSRDLTGFIDGTANPHGRDAREAGP